MKENKKKLLSFFFFLILQKEAIEKETKKHQLRAETLEQLSRTLQTERSNLIQELKQYESKPTAKAVVVDEEPTKNIEELIKNTDDSSSKIEESEITVEVAQASS